MPDRPPLREAQEIALEVVESVADDVYATVPTYLSDESMRAFYDRLPKAIASAILSERTSAQARVDAAVKETVETCVNLAEHQVGTIFGSIHPVGASIASAIRSHFVK